MLVLSAEGVNSLPLETVLVRAIKVILHFIADNRQNDLVRIVFFAFDRLEQILPPTFGKVPQFLPKTFQPDTSSTTSINSEREKGNVTRVLNSKVKSLTIYVTLY